MANFNKNTQTFGPHGHDKTIFEVPMIANKNGDVVTETNPFPVTVTNGWELNLAQGLVEGYSFIEKFGRGTLSTNTLTTLYDNSATVPLYPWPTTASTLVVTSDDTSDNATGDGARTVEVQGLDADYNLQTVILTVGGSASVETFIRVFRAKVLTAGATGNNEGNVDIEDTGGNVLARISKYGNNIPGAGQTYMALYTVPAGKTAYLQQWCVSSSKQNADTLATILFRDTLAGGDGAWQTKDLVEIQANSYIKDYKVPLRIPEKNDIIVRAFSSSGCTVASTFNLILVDN